ncbi:MAG: AAA family ATPase [Sulfurimonas sp.]|uniref:McrB family protein n=1 Tax=Sulfurimonas sp. TaxID=2022749 RepID=UPI0026242B0E|nr:AAA family ATPase [Sulfurimonas sp.]MDD2652753.1 AAA family ATPase [Sulfurimonas sp.]MDD3450613.1 AAA family ATPase [Sulfurimonas sp.]
MNENLSIAVLTHNPNGDWGDVRPLIEQQGYYEKWGKSINLVVGQTVLIYISSNIRQIQYIMEVTNVYDDSIDVKLIKKLSREQSQLLSFENLKKHGLKKGTINYILDNNRQLYEYVKSVINDDTIKEKKDKKLNIKNIILYGAPGVGKTHNYQNLISMIEEGKSQNEIFYTVSKNLHVDLQNETFESIKNEKRVEFVTFHQSYSYEDFIEGFRPSDNGNIELEDGIFKNIAKEANSNIVDSFSNNININFKSVLEQFQLKFEIGSKLKTYSNNSEFTISKYTDKSIHIMVNENKFSVSYLPLEEIYNSNKIKPINNPQDVIDALSGRFKGLATYYYSIFREMLLFKEVKQNSTALKNFYIVIDEINRGNISKIFGELITLIEEDKRDVYEVTLPYSKEKFKVPSNLYIIATMNSTDKSIATIDIALRRRFTFLKMKPNEDLVHVKAKELFNDLNKFIKENLNEDYMLGHSYFMKIESDEDLEFVKEYKIRPLLEEYFYADEKKYNDAINILNKKSQDD